jgi:hypothetical protein
MYLWAGRKRYSIIKDHAEFRLRIFVGTGFALINPWGESRIHHSGLPYCFNGERNIMSDEERRSVLSETMKKILLAME